MDQAKKTGGGATEEEIVLDAEKMVPWSEFSLPEALLKGLQAQGFSYPTPIQRALLPHALTAKVDVLGAAETGSGKTLAFGLPILKGILEDMEREKQQGRIRQDQGFHRARLDLSFS